MDIDFDGMGLAPTPEPPPAVEDIVEVYSFNTGLMVLLMILWSSLGHAIAARIKYVSEGSAACAMGLIAGLSILITQRYFTEESVHRLLTFNPADFFTYLLPPIIFYAGLSVKKKQFFRNFVSIASFGIVGTYVAFAIIAFVLYGFSKLPNILTLSDCLALGVIFAATDSVAVLQVLKQDKMPLLYSLVFGEGVINDATSVALLRAVQALDGTEVLNAGTVSAILVKFLYLFVASMGLGLAFGLGTSWLMKTFKSNSTPQEVALVGMLGYLSYLCGELMGLSGIVTLFCCAVSISHYALHNVSSMSRVTIVSAFQTLSYVSEGAIFIYVGMDTLDPIKWRNTKPAELIWLFCVLLLLMVLGRAAFVFPLSFVHNWWARDQLSVKEMVVIWWSGLIRGAVSVALVYYYFDPAGKSEDSHRATLITTTLLEVLCSIFVFGAVTKPLLDYLLGPLAIHPESSVSMELMAGRRRSHSRASDDKSGGGLYAVVSMAEDDEVANHMDGVATKLHGESFDSLAGESDDTSEWDGKHHDRLLGSHGQNLADVADNLQPAMAIQERTSSELARMARPRWGAVNEGNSPGTQQQPNNPFGYDSFGKSMGLDGQPGDGGNHAAGEAPSYVSAHHRQNGEAGPGRSGQPNGMANSQRARWQRPGASGRRESSDRGAGSSVSGGGPRTLPSPFESDSLQSHARAVAAVTEGLRQDDERAMVARTESLPNGRIHNWWTIFDARYMQPVFGGAPQPAVVELHQRTSRNSQGPHIEL